MLFKPQRNIGDTKYVPAGSWAGLSMAYSPMLTAEVFRDNNEQAAATEAADGFSSCQGIIFYNFYQAEFDNYYRRANVMCFSFSQFSE